MIELRERERRLQAQAASALLFRDADGGLEGFFRGSGFVGIDLQQNFAPQAVEKSGSHRYST